MSRVPIKRLLSTVTASSIEKLVPTIRSMLETSQPYLNGVNCYYVEGGKMVRPAIVLQLSRCLQSRNTLSVELDAEFGVLPQQRRLAEIVEMIHSASLLHDDVIDEAALRRGKPSANVFFSSKSAVLSGDYLLAQASVALSQMGNLQVVRLLATVIQDLVEGEMMQMNARLEDKLDMSYYMEKSYRKTASLIAKSCQAAAILGGHPTAVTEACFAFGRNLGLAFQLIDDKLDFVASEAEMGKPVASDLRQGTITAPVLFAMLEEPRIRDCIGRAFTEPGDCEQVHRWVRSGSALHQTQELAERFLNDALQALDSFVSLDTLSQSFASLVASVASRNR